MSLCESIQSSAIARRNGDSADYKLSDEIAVFGDQIRRFLTLADPSVEDGSTNDDELAEAYDRDIEEASIEIAP